ncbi:hypothetical protein EHM69_11810 [candidate division KSB1 bacterium]|nr:MAG: hypothetical protein EHM69_11810 [candidate division KSB1 bacterium]
MKAEDLSLSFRDIMRYVVPGAVALAIIIWFLNGFVGIHFGTFDADLGTSILFLLASYVVGHVLDLFGGIVLGKRMNSLAKNTVVAVKNASPDTFTQEFRDKLSQKVRERFNLPLETDEVFDLCDNAILGETAAQGRERLGALSGLYRGMLEAAWLGIGFSGLVVLKHLVLYILPLLNIIVPVTAFLDYEELHLVVGIVLLVLFVILLKPIRRRTESMTESYVYETFHAFYVIATKKKDEAAD